MTADPPRRPRRVLPVLALVAAVTFLGWSDVRYLITAPEARTAAAALRGSTVYVAPGEQEVLVASRVRQVIGDRPIVVAVLADTYDGDQLDGCKVVARLQPRTIVLAYLGGERGAYPAICATDRFPAPQNVKDSSLEDVSRTDTWLSGIARTAQQASQFRVNDRQADRTPEIEELVLAFDARSVVDYPDGVPTREAGADPRTWTAVLAQLAALVVVLGAAFAGLRWLVHRFREWLQTRYALRDRKLELDAQLSQVADRMVSARPELWRDDPAEAVRHAEAAERYLLALAAFEAARGPDELDAVAQALRRVDEALPRVRA